MFNSATMATRMKAQCQMHLEPFPYIWIPEFFHWDDYAEIQTELGKFDPTGRVGYEERSGLELYDPPDIEIFNSLKKCIGSEEFTSALFGYFDAKPFGKFDVTLNRDFFHKHYGPHLDYPPLRMNLQIYLPPDHSQESLGTVLGKKNDAGFEKTKQLSFLPNSAYAFISGPSTWHSLPIFDNGEVPRYSLLYRWKDQGKSI